ncbi:MAG: helix-turn-helix transcriptional regulator [Chloroflexi bacterium]|nr:helix-turn-helix transcriptional regulator [Chloroflexota bacterium]MBL7163740.1 helix-turn-helix transcriptional regulator [Anaerolineales bacterium]
MDPEIRLSAREQASLCSVFGNTQRVLIAWALGEEEVSVSDIAAQLEISLQNASQHLRLMKDKGILSSRRDGQTIYYRIAENELLKSCSILLKAEQYKK